MFKGLKKLSLAIKAEEKRLMERGKDFGLPLLVNKRFRERKKPGPKVNWVKRERKIEALVSRIKCREIIRAVSRDLIENWFPSYALGYVMNKGKDNIPIPHWFISRGILDYPPLTTVNFYLKTEFKKGRPVKPLLRIEINFTPKITLRSEFWTITIDEIYEQIKEMFVQVYGDFAKKKGIEIN